MGAVQEEACIASLAIRARRHRLQGLAGVRQCLRLGAVLTVPSRTL